MFKDRLLLLLCIVGYAQSQQSVQSVAIRRKKISQFKCDFIIVYTNTTVNLEASSIKCFPRKPKKTNLKVTLVTKEYKFITKINVNPTKIVEMEVVPPDTVITDLFQEEYKNLTSEMPQFSRCGGYGRNVNGVRGFTQSSIRLWKNAKVNWAFVSNGDGYKNYAFHTDEKIGVSETDVKVVMKAMKIIEDKTCIKFKRVRNPDKNKPWIVLFRDAQCTTSGCRCMRPYLAKIQFQELGNFGKPFIWNWHFPCFKGAFVDWLGTGKPRQLVLSATRIYEQNPLDIGLMVHELGHGLGLGHTQKRPDRDNYITVNWDNIDPNWHDQYEKCTGPDCETHGVPYDCESIMHYYDTAFSINNQPTMVPKNEKTCNLKNMRYKLVDSDVIMLKKMYCDTGGGKPVDGGWGGWEMWTSCSNNNAGKGDCIKKRSRYCNQPAKANGGKDCEGNDKETTVCQESELMNPLHPLDHTDCKITGGWSAWGAASTCNTECKSTQTRTCTNPKPFNDKACDGTNRKIEPCTGGDCPTSAVAVGVIPTPNYPENYPNNQDETWDLIVPDGSRINLTFFDFAIEYESSCSWDYVEVLDSDNSQMLKTCGYTSPGVVISKGNTMTVKFHSDSMIGDKGFEAVWKKADTSALGHQIKSIKSSNYPNSYTANLDEEYDVEVKAKITGDLAPHGRK